MKITCNKQTHQVSETTTCDTHRFSAARRFIISTQHMILIDLFNGKQLAEAGASEPREADGGGGARTWQAESA